MATDRDAQYDNSAKRLIAHKIILARILVKTVEEFKGMDPLEVAVLIEGLPYMQIADMLSISLPTVNYHVGFAMTALKNKLKHG